MMSKYRGLSLAPPPVLVLALAADPDSILTQSRHKKRLLAALSWACMAALSAC